MSNYKVAVIVGSNREGSLNRKLAHALAKLGEPQLSCSFCEIGDLPLYHPDVSHPAPALRFKAELEAADGLLVVTPEYNRSIPTLLKNAIDWASRPYGKNSWTGKPAAITGTSPGAIGTAVAQSQLRMVLGTLGVHVMGGEAYIQAKSDMIDSDHALTDPTTRTFLKAYMDQFASFTARLAPARASAAPVDTAATAYSPEVAR